MKKIPSEVLLKMYHNMLLTRKFEEKVEGAFQTGFNMTTTTFGAILAMWVVSWVGGIEIIHQMSQVLLIGLIFDVMNTWLTNAGILKWYATEGKGRISTSLRGGA